MYDIDELTTTVIVISIDKRRKQPQRMAEGPDTLAMLLPGRSDAAKIA